MATDLSKTNSPETPQPVLETRGLVLTYGEHTILEGVDLTVGPHETLAILASGGAGKTVLFRILIDLKRPTAGQVLWFGQDVAGLRKRRQRALRRHIGAVHHNGALFTDLTVTENLKLPMLELTDLDAEQIESTVRFMLTVTGLFPFRHLYPPTLSSVMVRQVALARALVLGPKLLICDDIFAGLDAPAQRQIDRSLRALHILRGATVILTHNVKVAFQLADRIAVLANGRIVASGSPETIRANTVPEVSALLDGEALGEALDPGDWVSQVMGRQ